MLRFGIHNHSRDDYPGMNDLFLLRVGPLTLLHIGWDEGDPYGTLVQLTVVNCFLGFTILKG